MKQQFETLATHCDRFVVLTKWYKKILLLNGIPEEKISYVPQGLAFNQDTPIVAEKDRPASQSDRGGATRQRGEKDDTLNCRCR